MRVLSVELLAQLEIDQATTWYADQSIELADRFSAEVRESFAIVMERPTSFAKITKLSRRYLFPNFPYKLIFQESNERIFVIAFSHVSRHPTYWQTREQ